MLKEYNRKLIFPDGHTYYGYAFGCEEERVCEIVFNTSMTGYQEILSDPSYTYQGVVMSYPLIGNYGMAKEDYESEVPTLGALIVSEYNDIPSNFRSYSSLGDVMKTYNIVGISGVDTRKLVREIRDLGSRRVLITGIDTTTEEGIKRLQETPVPHDDVKKVTIKEETVSEGPEDEFHVVAFDCGMKLNILRSLRKRNLKVTRVPYNTSADRIRSLNPDGIFLSNGPGNPEDVPELIQTLKEIRGEYPIFGICLGHQLICLSYGGKSFKMKFGHRGGNHPVMNLNTGKIEITSQNHSYAIDEESLSGTPLTVTHRNLLDQTVEGVCCKEDKIFSVQYHPESAPGPEDSAYLFEEFLKMMQEEKKDA